jgi:hypothetical protein
MMGRGFLYILSKSMANEAKSFSSSTSAFCFSLAATEAK